MSILHYTIGLPPERHGGSVLYAYDLMREQAKTDKVYALICGDTLIHGSRCKFRNIGKKGDIHVFSITNPLTPTLIYGCKEPRKQHRNVKLDYDNIKGFITKNCISIMHIHTFMGLHKDIVEFIKNLGVKIIYSTHDFHGICLHYDLIDFDNHLCNESNGAKCAKCNQFEPSDIFLRLASSSLYHHVKRIVNIKKTVKNSSQLNVNKNFYDVDEQTANEYNELLLYYKDYFKLIDRFHFNSTQTRNVYSQFLSDITGRVIPVITSGIADNRKPIANHDTITLGFIGSDKEYKGFPLLKEVLIELVADGYNNFKVLTYGTGKEGIDTECPNIFYMPAYKYSKISDVLYHLDGTIVPSKCYETFSLVTLESLSHGRPAIVSDHVGAKDIVAEYSPELIFTNKTELKSILRRILMNPDILKTINDKIMQKSWEYDIAGHTKDIQDLYNE